MHDRVTFEARLADALGRYADLAPTMDDDAIARQAVVAGGSVRRIGWLASLRSGGFDLGSAGQPMLRVAYLLVVLALLLAAILVAIVGSTFRNDPFMPLGRNGAIAFTLQGNNHDPAGTHLMEADGTGDHPIDAGRCPTYSKDGSVLASVSYEGSAYLVVEGASGQPSAKVLLADAPPTSVSYALSPDGTRVAWFKPIPSDPSSVELWIAPIAGGPGRRILPGSSVPNEFYASPLWSPDGGHIAFGSYVPDNASGEDGRSAIHVVAADGADLRRLTTRPALLVDGMSWSPDGLFIAYLALPGTSPIPMATAENTPITASPRDVFLIGVDGTGDRNLTNTQASESQPEWSADGARLAFETSENGEAARLATLLMSGPTPVGQPVLGPESPWFVWAPDGTELLWLEVSSLGPESYRSTLHSIDRDFRQSPKTLQAVDGLVVCTPSWQRLEP